LLEFLRAVWGSTPATVHTPYTNHSDPWQEKSWSWPDQAEAIGEWANETDAAGHSVYFAVVPFDGARQQQNAKPVQWCWADLDTANPESLVWKPTLAWESSPGSYQCLWRLDEPIPAAEASELSRRLAYATGADKSGWNITRVLRPPGMHNHKHKGAPPVKYMWANGPQYTVAQLRSEVPEHEKAESAELPGETSAAILSRFHLPEQALRLLLATPEDVEAAKTLPEGRSGQLHKLACLLSESGLNVGEVTVVTSGSPWNKFRGRPDELTRLMEGARKAAVQKPKPRALLSVRAQDIMAMKPRDAGWLIDGVWLADLWGIVGGEPKAHKSTLSIEAGVAVASGQPFLGMYDVHRQGPVLLIQEENDPMYLWDLLHKIWHTRGLLPDPAIYLDGQTTVLAAARDAEVRFISQEGFQLADMEMREQIEEEIRRLGPELVVFDPLYKMVGDVDISKEPHRIQPYLDWIESLSIKYHTATMVNHHLRKRQGKTDTARVGQRLSGSWVFHAWLKSALYSDLIDEDKHLIRVTREFTRASRPALNVQFHFGEFGTTDYSTDVSEGLTDTPSGAG